MAPSAQTAASGATGKGRVLRVCVVSQGKVLDEQRFDRRQSVTVGSAPDNTFVFTEAGVPKSHALFVMQNGAYELRLTDAMRAQVSVTGGETAVEVAALKAQGVLQERGEAHALPLTERHRGKIVVGGATLIFQFVLAPVVAPTMQMDVKGPRFAERDLLFWGCMSVVGILEIVFILILRVQPLPKPVTLETMDARFAQLIIPPKKKGDKNPVEMAKKAKEKEAPKKEKPEVAKVEPEPKPKDQDEDEPPSKAQAERRTAVRKNIANRGILAVLGTAGSGSAAGAVADVFGQGQMAGDLDNAFQGISGVGLATGNAHSTRGGGSGKQASIGGLATAGGGRVGLGSKSEAKVGQVSAGDAEVDGSLDSGAIAKVIQSRMPMVKDCYERELKRDPGLQGRVEIEFTIGEDGRVESARVSANRMGSDGVGACIVSRLRTWRFPKPAGGSVTVNFPFLFAPSG